MSFTNTINNNVVPTQTHLVAQVTVQYESISPQEIYRQEMVKIWQNVSQLPSGQDTVVLSQLWEFGKKPLNPTATDFPALATYGFIAEQKVEGMDIWNATTPYLHEFWRIGIRVSNAYGFTLQRWDLFEANLQTRICKIFN